LCFLRCRNFGYERAAFLVRDAAISGVHESKYDGYRLQLHINEGRVRLFTRRGHDWTWRSLTAWNIKAYKAIVDGELIVPAENGRSDFQALERDLGAGRSERFAYHAFDLLGAAIKNVELPPSHGGASLSVGALCFCIRLFGFARRARDEVMQQIQSLRA
jgi:hypothetical protein